MMKEKLDQILVVAKEEIGKSESLKNLEDLRIKYLGKKGELTAILKGMKDLTNEERPIIGKVANEVRSNIEALLEASKEQAKEKEMQKQLEEEEIDVTLPPNVLKWGIYIL